MISTIPPTAGFITHRGGKICARLEGLLQGTYAHLAVSDYWRTRQRATTGRAAEAAAERFAFWQGHTREAIETLAHSGSMTPLGMRFVEEMRRSAGQEQGRAV